MQEAFIWTKTCIIDKNTKISGPLVVKMISTELKIYQHHLVSDIKDKMVFSVNIQHPNEMQAVQKKKLFRSTNDC